MNIRRYHQGEEDVLWQLLYNTVHHVNIKDYSKEQVGAWAPDDWDKEQWKERLLRSRPFVVEVEDEILGFAELESSGHIDCFFCAHHWQGKGVGSMLLNAIEAEAKKLTLTYIFTEASITAKSFFEKKGFTIGHEKIVSLRGVRFPYYGAIKQISS
ncbi:MAG: GNAT family N-acetyltransferase [Mariprofundaceae bacterium]